MNFSEASSEITKSLITEMKYIIFHPNEVTNFETLECTYHIMILTLRSLYNHEQNKFKSYLHDENLSLKT
jgi:hypothetical protein